MAGPAQKARTRSCQERSLSKRSELICTQGSVAVKSSLMYCPLFCVLCWNQDDSEDSETDGDEEDGSQSSTNLQATSKFHRYELKPSLLR